MFWNGFRLACAGLILAFSPILVQAQDESTIVDRLREQASEDEALSRVLTQINRQLDSQQFSATLRRHLGILYQVAPEGELTAERLELFKSRELAAGRATIISQFIRLDLDADGEISQYEREQITGSSAAEVDILFGSADQNDDDRISFSEILEYSVQQVSSQNGAGRYEYLLYFDADQNGTVSSKDIIATITALDELKTELQLPDVAGRPRQPVTCEAPRPAEDDQVIVMSSYEGSSLSTVSVGGQDNVTQVAHIEIEAGDTPLYIVLTSYESIIWDITGETDRVASLVVQRSLPGNGGGAGVIGIDESKITFVRPSGCFDSYAAVDSSKGAAAFRKVERSLGRAPDTMLSYYTIRSVALPSGNGKASQGEGSDTIIFGGRSYTLTPDGLLLEDTEGQTPDEYPAGATLTHRSLLRFYDDGVREVDIDTVVSPQEIAQYDILPQQAGLLQLILDGRIRYTPEGQYLIVEEIERFPAGLAGAHSVKFLLAEGVKMPGGSPSHSSVRSAKTRECLIRRCHP